MVLLAFLGLTCITFNSIPIILNLLTNRNIAFIYSVPKKKKRISHSQAATNIDYSTVALPAFITSLSTNYAKELWNS